MTVGKQTERHILIVSQAFDPHTDELLVLLRYLGQEPIRLNTEAIPANSLLSSHLSRGQARVGSACSWEREPGDGSRYTLLLDGRTFEAEHIGAVWWRRPAPYQFAGELSPEEQRLAEAETE